MPREEWVASPGKQHSLCGRHTLQIETRLDEQHKLLVNIKVMPRIRSDCHNLEKLLWLFSYIYRCHIAFLHLIITKKKCDE